MSTRVIRRYKNRKLYDTTTSKYVTLLDILNLVKVGESVKVVTNGTKEDITSYILYLSLIELDKGTTNFTVDMRNTLETVIRSNEGTLVEFTKSLLEKGVINAA